MVSEWLAFHDSLLVTDTKQNNVAPLPRHRTAKRDLDSDAPRDGGCRVATGRAQQGRRSRQGPAATTFSDHGRASGESCVHSSQPAMSILSRIIRPATCAAGYTEYSTVYTCRHRYYRSLKASALCCRSCSRRGRRVSTESRRRMKLFSQKRAAVFSGVGTRVNPGPNSMSSADCASSGTSLSLASVVAMISGLDETTCFHQVTGDPGSTGLELPQSTPCPASPRPVHRGLALSGGISFSIAHPHPIDGPRASSALRDSSWRPLHQRGQGKRKEIRVRNTTTDYLLPVQKKKGKEKNNNSWRQCSILSNASIYLPMLVCARAKPGVARQRPGPLTGHISMSSLLLVLLARRRRKASFSRALLTPLKPHLARPWPQSDPPGRPVLVW